MKQLIAMGFGALALVTAGTASAADLPARIPGPPPQAPVFVVPMYNWTGFYIGVNGGGASAHKCWDFVTLAGPLLREGCHKPSGGAVGGQIGYNWQAGPFVFGIEGTGDWTSMTGSNNSFVFIAPQNTNRTKTDAILALTGRAGYAWNAALFYVKGGGAWADDHYDTRNTATGITNATANEWRAGWTGGVGFEYGLNPNWSLAVEYDHYDFGKKSVTFIGAGAGVDSIGQTVDMITARMNWRFGGNNAVVARY